MPTFDQSTVSAAPPEEVWKLLYDPARFPQWWAGTGSVDTGGDAGDYTMFPDGYPDFPMPQALDTSHENGTVKISCLVSDLCFGWRLRPSGSWHRDLRARRDPRPRGRPPGRAARDHQPVPGPPRRPRGGLAAARGPEG